MRYDDIDQDYIRRKRERRQKMRLALILTLLSMIGFVIMLIYLDGQGSDFVSGNSKNAVDGLLSENGEIIPPTPNDATVTQESSDGALFFVDDDGGVWVIEAFVVPDEWRRSGDNKEEVTDAREQP